MTENQDYKNLYIKEKIKYLEEENQLKNKIIKLLENKIKKLENKNFNELYSIKNLPINPKLVYMLYNEKQYIFICHRSCELDIINNENT